MEDRAKEVALVQHTRRQRDEKHEREAKRQEEQDENDHHTKWKSRMREWRKWGMVRSEVIMTQNFPELMTNIESSDLRTEVPRG